MTTSHIDIDRSTEKAYVWCNAVAAELGTEDGQAAYRTLRAFPHVLRDRLSVDEAASALLHGETEASPPSPSSSSDAGHRSVTASRSP